jgi:hypothetical protein
MDITPMRRNSKVYMSAWEMLRHNPMEEEAERSL